jgi:MFS transporter, ACS family, glucarate transporter
MQDELHISPHAWGWVGSVFAISYAVFEIPSGYLGDRLGARMMLTRIVLWWSVFTSLTGTMSRYLSLLITRFLFGARGRFLSQCLCQHISLVSCG